MGKRTRADASRRFPRLTIAGPIAVVVAAGVAAGAVLIKRQISAARLPALPDLSAHTKAVGEHVREKLVAAQADPRSPSEVGALCLAYHADLFYDEADRCYALAEKLSPSEWRWTYYRALIHSERARSEALAEAMQRVVEQAPQFSPAWWRLGEAAFKEGRYDRAEAAWKRAAAAPEPERGSAESPQHAADLPVAAYASLGLARIALAREDAEGARQTLEQVTARSPRFGPAFRLLAQSYTALGRTGDADRAMHRAGRLPPYAPYADPLVDRLARESRNSTFLLRQASEADVASNAAWSEYVTRRALEFDPNNPEVVSKLGRLLRTLGRSGEALEFFRKYNQMVPDDFQALGQTGSCLSDLGRFAEAEPLLRRALERLDDALTHYNLGALLSATGRFDEAVAEYQRALERDPDDPDARGNLAAVLVRLGKLSQASRELARVLELDPDNAAAHTNYGVLLLREGREDQAAREFQAALRINPQLIQASEALRQLGR